MSMNRRLGKETALFIRGEQLKGINQIYNVLMWINLRKKRHKLAKKYGMKPCMYTNKFAKQ